MPPKVARVRTYGNDIVDSLPPLVQEWYHAVGTPMGIGNIDWARECVKKGVDVNARLDAFGGNALFMAIEQCNFSMIKHLVEEVGMDLAMVDYGGYNAVDYAAACNHHHPDKPPMDRAGNPAEMDIASYLKTHGMKYTWFGAALAADIDRLWEFMENGQDVNERGGHFNRTALQEAADNGNTYTARFLMVKGGLVGIQTALFQNLEVSECTAHVQGKLMAK